MKGAKDMQLLVKGPVRMPTKVLDTTTTRKSPCGARELPPSSSSTSRATSTPAARTTSGPTRTATSCPGSTAASLAGGAPPTLARTWTPGRRQLWSRRPHHRRQWLPAVSTRCNHGYHHDSA